MKAGGMSTEQTHQIGGNPFDPANDDGYRHWRDLKLAAPSLPPDELVVEIRDLEHPTTAERMALLERIRRANMAIYHCKLTEHRGAILSFAEHFGLFHLDRNPAAADDGLSAIQVHAERQQGEFIPYTERALRWHTDGYYNPPGRRIHAFILHCVRPAAEGGVNRLLDPELLYLRLRDEDPDLVAALMHPAAMVIPAHVENGIELRAEQSGPVFSISVGVTMRPRVPRSPASKPCWRTRFPVPSSIGWKPAKASCATTCCTVAARSRTARPTGGCSIALASTTASPGADRGPCLIGPDPSPSSQGLLKLMR